MRNIALILMVFISLVLFGCKADETTAQSNANIKTLTIGIMPDIDSVPFIIAQERGYFKEQGIKVELKQFKSAMDRDAAFQSGNIDGAVSDLLAVAFAKDGGMDVKVTSQTDGSYRLAVNKEAGINSFVDLQTKDIAVSRNTIIEYVTDRFLTSNRLQPEDIKKVVIPQIPVRLEMLQNNKLTGATLPEPMASIAVSNGCKLIAKSEDYGINPGVMMFSGKYLEDNREVITKFYESYNKAVEYLNNHKKEEYIELVVKKSSFPVAAKEALILPIYHKASLPSDSEIKSVMEWLTGRNLIKKSFTSKDIVVDVLAK